ncbi:Ig-like domain-containing protein [Dactylosporangium sp. CA-233914]|uniref:Ig-like domain-containing protein n=1 Tax=Dactylosporangium sp. CA-233914 TaxID=3239934 RepID=UPI003D9509A9
MRGTLCNVPVNSAAPVVLLSSPTAGQVFPAGAAIPLSASAYDPEAGGAITRVEFHVDGVLRSVDTTLPYTATVQGLPAGPHTVTATAFDNGNPVRSTQTATAFSVG